MSTQSTASIPSAADQGAAETPRRPRVAVIFGGRSSEHAVSCATAAGVLAAIDAQRYDVIPVGITRSGEWVLPSADPRTFALTAGSRPEVVDTGSTVVLPLGTHRRELTVTTGAEPPRLLGEVDVVFPLLHGPFGEDGTIQGLFELADVRYVGSGVLSSAAMMDKHVMKLIFAGHGLPVGPYTVITDLAWRRDPAACLDAAAALRFPVFVKPARAGSSMGISKVTDQSGLTAAIEAARLHDPKVIVEAGQIGRELECAVLQGRGIDAPRTSRLGEIVSAQHEFYDFEAKYLADDVVLSAPADVPGPVEERVRDLAARAFEAGGCEGLARVDFFFTQAGDVLINEINTMPGFTPHSMYPVMWEAAGLSYTDLITELIELALARPTGLR